MDNIEFSDDKKTLVHCPDVEEYVIPDHVEKVLPDAFDTAPNLRRIIFNNVLSIPKRVVEGTYEVPDYHGGGWYGDYDEGTSFTFHGLFEKCPYIEQIEIGEKTKEIAPFAMAGLGRVKSMNLNTRFYLDTMVGLDSLKVLTAAAFCEPGGWRPRPNYSSYYVNFVDANGDSRNICSNNSDGRIICSNRNIYSNIFYESCSVPDDFLLSLEECHFLASNQIVDNIRLLALCKNVKRIFLPECARKEIEWELLPQDNGSGSVIQYIWE